MSSARTTASTNLTPVRPRHATMTRCPSGPIVTSRSPSMLRGAAGTRTYTYHLPPALGDVEAGRGGPRRIRQGGAPGARARRRGRGRGAGPRDEAGPRPGPLRRAAPATARYRSCPMDRRALPGAGRSGPPGDAAAGHARAPRAGCGASTDRSRATGGARPDDGLTPPDLDLLDQLERGARPVRNLVAAEGRPALVRRLRALERREPRHPRLDADRDRCRPALRALALRDGRASAHRPAARPRQPRRPPSSRRLGRPASVARSSPIGTVNRPSRASFAGDWRASRSASARADPLPHGRPVVGAASPWAPS